MQGKILARSFGLPMMVEDCKNVIREYLAKKQRIGQQLAAQEHVFYQKYDEVAPENILQVTLDKYESDGIPTYAIYNTKGEQTFKNIGFPGNDVIRKELEAASK